MEKRQFKTGDTVTVFGKEVIVTRVVNCDDESQLTPAEVASQTKYKAKVEKIRKESDYRTLREPKERQGILDGDTLTRVVE